MSPTLTFVVDVAAGTEISFPERVPIARSIPKRVAALLLPETVLSSGMVICCADNLDVRRLLYRQGTGDDANVKWLDLRAQGRNATLISYMLNPNLVDTVLTGEEGSFSCQAQSWDGSAKGVNMMNNVIASIAAQWIQKWFNKQEVTASMVFNI